MKTLIYLFALILFPAVSFCQETVTISPSWGQSFHYANSAGQTVWTVIGFILIVVAILVIVLGSKDKLTFIGVKQGLAVNLICFVLAAGGLAAILIKPGSIKFNNDKVLDKVYYNQVGEKHIWDSLENNCLIVDGPYHCK